MERKIETCDVLVVGAGLAGLTTANLLAEAGFSVICVDRRAPDEGAGQDLRTAALLAPAIETLKRIGAWDGVAAEATELATMRMIDATPDSIGPLKRPLEAEFDALEIDRPVFGFNMSNAGLMRALAARLAERETAVLKAPAEIRHLLLRDDAAIATLGDGAQIRAALVVGADGRDSLVRERAGVTARRWSYGQRAMVCFLAHERPHGNVSIEVHSHAGPFLLAPYSDDADGAHRSSMVWVETEAEAERLTALPDAEFALAASEKSRDAFGPLRVASRRMSWPAISLLADRLHGKRAALIAEAAHVAPPIGAQGLNMSVADAVCLSELLIEARANGRDIGGQDVLAKLTARRWPDIAARIAGTAALNAAAIGAVAPVRLARRIGLAAISRVPPLKRAVMRFGMGG